jgi:hypothetical protein
VQGSILSTAKKKKKLISKFKNSQSPNRTERFIGRKVERKGQDQDLVWLGLGCPIPGALGGLEGLLSQCYGTWSHGR